MAINKKLIHLSKGENYDIQKANGNILDSSICFIQDRKTIVTHETEYKTQTWGYLDFPPNGIYAVKADGFFTDASRADSTCKGVALIMGPHHFMIEKTEDYSSITDIYLWEDPIRDTSLPNIKKVGGGKTTTYSYLYEDGTGLNRDWTTWIEPDTALGDFNGKSNSKVLEMPTGNPKNIGYCLSEFNRGIYGNNQGYSNWYIPSCGQMGLVIVYKNEINEMMTLIGGTKFVKTSYWTSTEYAKADAWYVNFWDNSVGMYTSNKDNLTEFRVRFVKDL